MHPILYFVLVLGIIGGIGVLLAILLKKADKKELIIKFAYYILIILLVVESVIYNFFIPLASIVVLLGSFELLKTVFFTGQTRLWSFIYTLIYAVVSYGFILFTISIQPHFQLFVLLVIFTFDGFSQISGQVAGRRKLISKISPKKTVAGLVGGSIFAILSAIIARNWIEYGVVDSIIAGAAISFFAFIGDIFASIVKRRFGIKDFSNLIPGHGGIIDRFDSIMFSTACVVWLSFLISF